MRPPLEAIIGRARAVQAFADRWVLARIVALPQDYALVPVTEALREDVEDLLGGAARVRFPDFIALSDAVAHVVAEATAAGALAFVETAGPAGPRAVVWERGRLTFGPEAHAHAVDRALRHLGVRTRGAADAGEMLGLARLPDTEAVARLPGATGR